MGEWRETTLGDVLKLKNGYAFKSKKYVDTGIPVIRISDINDKLVTSVKAKRVVSHEDYDGFLVERGDILIAMSGATTGKFGIYHSDEKAYQNQRVGNFQLTAEDELDKRFLFYFIESLRGRILADAYGGAQPNISAKKIESQPIRLPPLPEQRAIVAKLEALLGALDRSKGELEVAREKLGVYRQSVLKEAFGGRLTGEWRKSNRVSTKDEVKQNLKKVKENYQSDQLLKWKEKLQLWEESGSLGKKPRKPGKLKKETLISDEIMENLLILPDEWSYQKMAVLAVDMCLGKMLDREKNAGTLMPYLGNINVRWGGFRLDALKKMRVEVSEIDRYKVEKGDLIICEGGEPGRCAIWKTDQQMIIQKALHRVRFSAAVMDARFAFYYLKFTADTGLLSKFFTGTTIKHLTGKGLSEVPVPLPSLPEQHQIVAEIESRFSVADALEREIVGALERVEGVRMGVLKRAFGGELV